ncbi:MAG: hypothetical protein AAFQ82_08500, partial [Myxococcota bacterium]
MGTREDCKARLEWAKRNELVSALAQMPLHGAENGVAPNSKLRRLLDDMPGLFSLPILDFLDNAEFASQAPRPVRKAIMKHVDGLLRLVATQHGLMFDPARLALEDARTSKPVKVDANRLEDFAVLTLAELADGSDGSSFSTIEYFDDHSVEEVESGEVYLPEPQRSELRSVIERWRARLYEGMTQGPSFEAELMALEKSVSDSDPVFPLYDALRKFRQRLAKDYAASTPVFAARSRVQLLDRADEQMLTVVLESSAGEVVIFIHHDDGGAPSVRIVSEMERSIELDLVSMFYYAGLRNDVDDPTHAAHARIRDYLQTEPWERTLDWVGTLIGQSDGAEPGRDAQSEERLVWGISLDPSQPVTPMLERQGKRGNWLKPRKTRACAVMPDAISNLVDQSLLDRLVDSERYFDDAQRVALESLVGREGLVDTRTKLPTTLRRYHPKLRLESDPEGLVLHIELDGVAMAVTDLRGSGGVDLGVSERYRGYELDRSSGMSLVENPELGYVLMDWRAPYMQALEGFGESGRVYPHAAFARLDPLLRALESVLDIEWSTSDENEDHLIRSQPTWLFRVSGGRLLRVQGLVQPHPGSGLFRIGDGSPVVPAVVDGGLKLVERQLSAEKARVESLLAALPGDQEFAGAIDRSFPLDDREDLVPFLARCEASNDVRVEWIDADPIHLCRSSERLALSVTSGTDWFDLYAELEAPSDKVTLAALVEARRRGKSFVRLGKDNYLALTEGIAQQIAVIEPRATVDGDAVRIPSA